MIAILSLLLVLALSLFATRIATISLTYTGLSRQTARFQARSAFTGVGFTTSESEQIVNHPVRRRIVLLVMLLGNAGIVTAVATLMLGFLGAKNQGLGALGMAERVGMLGAGVALLFAIASSKTLDRLLHRLVGWALKRFTDLDIRDYAGLLHLGGEYAIGELFVREDDWLAGHSLVELDLAAEGLLVLAVERKGTFLGAPGGDTRLLAGDTLLLYGHGAALKDLDERTTGPVLMGRPTSDLRHLRAKARQEEMLRQEARAEAESANADSTDEEN